MSVTREGLHSTNSAPSPRSHAALLFVPRDASAGRGQPQPDRGCTDSLQAGHGGLGSLGLVSRRCAWCRALLGALNGALAALVSLRQGAGPCSGRAGELQAGFSPSSRGGLAEPGVPQEGCGETRAEPCSSQVQR